MRTANSVSSLDGSGVSAAHQAERDLNDIDGHREDG
jgi:hypothetical protein